jgi:hypothetical protein
MLDGAAKPAPFIVGVGRSGTTLLRLMLDAHPELAIPAETHFLVDILAIGAEESTKDRFFRAVTQAATWPNLALDECTVRNALAEIEPFAAAKAVRAIYRLYAHRFGKQRWGDKTPPYRRHMIGIQRLLPEAHFIHIIRDGRDVALSYRGLWFGPGDNIEAQARFWVEQVRAARAQAAALAHYLEIKYEALVNAPEATLRTICDYLEMGYDPRMLDYHLFAFNRLAEIKCPFGPPDRTPADIDVFLSIHDHTRHRPDPSQIGRWRTEMQETELCQYEAIATDLLCELGYETRLHPVGNDRNL